MPFIVDRARCKWTARSAVELNIENERCAVMCSRCRKNLKFVNFTSFRRQRQRIVLQCVPHVQHDYFSSFNQSDYCFWRRRCLCRRPCLSSLIMKISRCRLANYVKTLPHVQHDYFPHLPKQIIDLWRCCNEDVTYKIQVRIISNIPKLIIVLSTVVPNL